MRRARAREQERCLQAAGLSPFHNRGTDLRRLPVPVSLSTPPCRGVRWGGGGCIPVHSCCGTRCPTARPPRPKCLGTGDLHKGPLRHPDRYVSGGGGGRTNSRTPTHPTAIRSLEGPPSPLTCLPHPTPPTPPAPPSPIPSPLARPAPAAFRLAPSAAHRALGVFMRGEAQHSPSCQHWGAEVAGKVELVGRHLWLGVGGEGLPKVVLCFPRVSAAPCLRWFFAAFTGTEGEGWVWSCLHP